MVNLAENVDKKCFEIEIIAQVAGLEDTLVIQKQSTFKLCILASQLAGPFIKNGFSYPDKVFKFEVGEGFEIDLPPVVSKKPLSVSMYVNDELVPQTGCE